MAPLALPPVSDWPQVGSLRTILHADGRAVQALVQAGYTGSCGRRNGNGTLSLPLEAALRLAAQTGVRVLRASRCLVGPVSTEPGLLPAAPSASPVKAGSTCCSGARRANRRA